MGAADSSFYPPPFDSIAEVLGSDGDADPIDPLTLALDPAASAPPVSVSSSASATPASAGLVLDTNDSAPEMLLMQGVLRSLASSLPQPSIALAAVPNASLASTAVQLEVRVGVCFFPCVQFRGLDLFYDALFCC